MCTVLFIVLVYKLRLMMRMGITVCTVFVHCSGEQTQLDDEGGATAGPG